MKIFLCGLTLVLSAQVFAYLGPKLTMTSERPNYTCEIFKDKVVIIRKVGGMKFTKTNNVKTDGVDSMIEKAYLKGPMIEQKTEYTAVYLSRNVSTNAVEAKTFNIKYNDSEFANNLIYLMTTLCETRNL